MWPEAEALFAAHRATLAASGLPLAARLEPVDGMLSAYTNGRVLLALPDPATEAGRLQALLLAGLLGVERARVTWLFRALLPRLVAHELGHALRAEAGLLGADVREEERVAERLAELLSRPLIAAGDRRRARDLLGGVVERFDGVAAAASLHRRAPEARVALGLSASAADTARARDHLQSHYHRDLTAYLRTSVVWAWIDLSLDCSEDSLDAFQRDHLALAH